MTKHIRIENADTSDHKVNVFVEGKDADGEWARVGGPTQLNFPTAMFTGLIYNGQRLVIEEAPPEAKTGG